MRADDGSARATGLGNRNAKTDNPAIARLSAERGAFLDALAKLKPCLQAGEESKLSGWEIAAIRYFDSDPVVEIDLVARLGEETKKVSALGSALPSKARLDSGATLAQLRIETTRAATVVAQRNAKESLDALLPSSSKAGAELRSTLQGTLGSCAATDVTYWDDQAVSVRVTCFQGVLAQTTVEPSVAPKLLSHGKQAAGEPAKAATK